jgi:hypothetical protein
LFQKTGVASWNSQAVAGQALLDHLNVRDQVVRELLIPL